VDMLLLVNLFRSPGQARCCTMRRKSAESCCGCFSFHLDCYCQHGASSWLRSRHRGGAAPCKLHCCMVADHCGDERVLFIIIIKLPDQMLLCPRVCGSLGKLQQTSLLYGGLVQMHALGAEPEVLLVCHIRCRLTHFAVARSHGRTITHVFQLCMHLRAKQPWAAARGRQGGPISPVYH
jgi:hypothetical protein